MILICRIIVRKVVITDGTFHTRGQHLRCRFGVGQWLKSYRSFVVGEGCPASSQSRCFVVLVIHVN
jgi:hypothetical protein